MSSVRKRAWMSEGVQKESWVFDYVDQRGKRCHKTFGRKKDADAEKVRVDAEVQKGEHVADSATITVAAAAEFWLARARKELELGTLHQYEQYVNNHIIPFIGSVKISKLTVPRVRAFLDDLDAAGRSPHMIKTVKTSLGSIIAEAQERGFSIRNAVRDMRKTSHVQLRRKAKLQYGVDIPTREEIRDIINHSRGWGRAVLVTAIGSGLRSSELRGLRWSDVELDAKRVHVRQRADRGNIMGMPKSVAGQRAIPIAPHVANTLREWKLACPRGEANLVFPNSLGKVSTHTNLLEQALWPPQFAAGIVVQRVACDRSRKPKLKDGKQQTIVVPKYEGMHSLRHWFASWCINRETDGGLGLPAKSVQTRLGHSTIAMTLDVYGHLFPNLDDDEQLARAERALLGL